MTEKPEEVDAQQNPGRGSDDEVIAEALQLLADFDNKPLSHMTPLFYQHGYEELRMITQDLLRILGHDPTLSNLGKCGSVELESTFDACSC